MVRRTWVVVACVAALTLILTASPPVGAGTNEGWSPAETVEDNGFGDAMFPELAMNEAGDAFVVWQQNNGSRTDIWANVYDPDTGWGVAEPIESNEVDSSYSPEVAIDKDGNAVAIWSEHPGSQSYIWTRLYVKGEGWEAPQMMNHSYSGFGLLGNVVFDGYGNAFAIWMETNLRASRYVKGIGWGGEEIVSSHMGAQYQSPISIGVDGSGNAYAVWSELNSDRYSIWANRYTVGTGWETPGLLETDDSGDAFEPVVRADEDGNAIAVWRQSEEPYTVLSGTWHLWSNRFVPGTGWGAAELREDATDSSAYGVTLAMFGFGDAIAAWYEAAGSVLKVYTSRFSEAHGWQAPALIDGGVKNFTHDPQIATNREGRALMVYHDDNEFRFTRCTAETGWTSSEPLLPDSTFTAQAGQGVGIDRYGDGLAVWFKDDGTRYNVYASSYIAPPPSLEVGSAEDNLSTDEPMVTVSGNVDPLSDLSVNGLPVHVAPNGSFSVLVALTNGSNRITLTATDSAGRSTTNGINVTYTDPVPPLLDELDLVREDLSDTRAELNDTSDRLDRALNDLDTTQTALLVLAVILVAAVVAACVLALLVFRARRKAETDMQSKGPPAQP